MGKRDKPKSQGRKLDIKETKKISLHDGYISFSFRYFQDNDTPPAQSLEDWQKDERLLDMLKSLVHLSCENIELLKSRDKKLSLYGKFPDKSVNDFPLPSNCDENENWGTLRKIGGQKTRIAGFLRDNVFYIVYLDKNHLFYKSEK